MLWGMKKIDRTGQVWELVVSVNDVAVRHEQYVVIRSYVRGGGSFHKLMDLTPKSAGRMTSWREAEFVEHEVNVALNARVNLQRIA